MLKKIHWVDSGLSLSLLASIPVFEKGYKACVSFIDTMVDSNVDGNYSFALNDYSYKFLDVYKTCMVTYEGDLFKNTILGWIPEKSTQVLEFYAPAADKKRLSQANMI